MKYQWYYLLLFCFGFALAATLNFNLSCSEKESPTQPQSNEQNNSEYSETQAMQNLSDSLIAAFKSENKNKVISCLSDNSKEVYSNILNNSTKSLSDFGTALEKRKLVFASQLFAEYEITIDGETYTIDYGNGGDDIWKLIRL